MREKCLIISKLCVGLTFYITLCCLVTCLFCVKTARKKRQAGKTSKRTGRGGGKGKILVKLSLYICVCRKIVVPLQRK